MEDAVSTPLGSYIVAEVLTQPGPDKTSAFEVLAHLGETMIASGPGHKLLKQLCLHNYGEGLSPVRV